MLSVSHSGLPRVRLRTSGAVIPMTSRRCNRDRSVPLHLRAKRSGERRTSARAYTVNSLQLE